MPEEKQRKSMRTSELDRIGVKTIKMRPEVAASSGAHNKKLN